MTNLKKKIIYLSLIVSLFAIVSVRGTLSYFSDRETKDNTFTLGNVDMTLTEPQWDKTEKKLLIPGIIIPKDPTITLSDDSQEAFIFFDMQLPEGKQLLTMMGQWYDHESKEYTFDNAENFLNELLADSEMRRTVVDAWFLGISHENWKIMNKPTIKADNSLDIRLGYQGGTLSAGESTTFMNSFTFPKNVTTKMIPNDLSILNMNFTAYAIQKIAIDSLDQAYTLLFN